MSNVTITVIALAIIAVCTVLGGIILIVIEILDERKKRRNNHPVWFHHMDIAAEVEKMKGEDEE